jgi:hypothetical protein
MRRENTVWRETTEGEWYEERREMGSGRSSLIMEFRFCTAERGPSEADAFPDISIS